MCNYNHELCQYDLRGMSKHEVNQHYFEFIRNATKEEREANGWDNKNTRGLYKCKICGREHFIKNATFKNSLQICENNCNGNGCGNGTVIIGYNNLMITHPQLVEYFMNKEDVYINTNGTKKKVEACCIHCGYKKEISITNLVRHGFGCNRCGDGISYPEKVMMNVLEDLDINFKFQFKFDDYKQQYRYDFHLIDLDTIIEVHGGQHYRSGYGYMKTYEEEHENDMYKYDLAILHGYECNRNYFVIDARESNIEWLKNNIEQCNLFEQFDLSNIDWQEIDVKSQKSLKIEICNYWREQKTINKDLTTTDVAQCFGVDKNTIVRYLKWGNENGFCKYDAKEEAKIANGKKTNKRKKYWVSLGEAVYFINDKKEVVCRAYSVEELSRLTGINATSLRRVLREKQPLKVGNHSTYDKKYKGYCVVLAEEYDLQFNRNSKPYQQ